MTIVPISVPTPARDRIVIFDTTLRDGEQSAGASMTFDEKIQVAELLDAMGVDVIEAGFPIASEGDFEAVSEIARRVKTAIPAGLARAAFKDIDRAADALRHARAFRIHTFISTSPVHMKYKLQMEADAVLEKVIASVTRARSHTDDVEWSAEDATRTEPDFLARCVEAAIRAGATTINLPDTVGYTTPDEYSAMFRSIIERVPNADKAVFSTHCHNDLGMAVANSLAGVIGGARQIECTVNGLGERAGNAALEEIVMAIRTRSDVLPFTTGIRTPMLTQASKLVSTVTGFPVQYNKAIVGKNAFAHESGIHQDGMLKHVETYEIMRPEDVGVRETNLVMGKHSGRHAFREKLKDLGYDLGENALEEAFNRMKALADRKKVVYDEDIEALVEDEITSAAKGVKVIALTVIAGTGGPQKAIITMDVGGQHITKEANGTGPIDATFNAIKAVVPHEAKLQLYQVHAVTEGTDAQAEVSVRLQEGGQVATGRGADVDTLVSSARAYVAALNKLSIRRQKLVEVGATEAPASSPIAVGERI
ncbi:2-isopropylmalate synthase [Siculibacillus lacustris]|uniref:2-isopropylmalate synthase n=1 Tax=Siculibacillus lacustris TaxID=1549641 RepID=A0A4Q9VUB0_9HYPH|nr:2-isopropylmalate synthase [Siculibacillus lacustris]TBW39254.1 2-isopropylmalate synthase [Siculibacillus lacustris]